MSIIWTIIIGLIVGIVAKFLMPGRDPGGFVITAIIGIVGSVIATFLGQIRDLAKVEPRRTPSPAFVVSAHAPDVLARIDPLLRDEIAGLPVRWQTV